MVLGEKAIKGFYVGCRAGLARGRVEMAQAREIIFIAASLSVALTESVNTLRAVKVSRHWSRGSYFLIVCFCYMILFAMLALIHLSSSEAKSHKCSLSLSLSPPASPGLLRKLCFLFFFFGVGLLFW